MPTLEFKGKQFIYSHHLSVPFRELIDCILIDPPCNTANEGWCYNDNVRSPLRKERLKKAAN